MNKVWSVYNSVAGFAVENRLDFVRSPGKYEYQSNNDGVLGLIRKTLLEKTANPNNFSFNHMPVPMRWNVIELAMLTEWGDRHAHTEIWLNEIQI